MDMDVFDNFTMLSYDILLEYHNIDCSHPNVPWEPCCGCGLTGCKVQKGFEDFY